MRKHAKQHATRGFTLVEVIVGVGLIALIAGVTIAVTANQLRSEAIIETADIAARDAIAAVRAVTADIAGASAIIASATVAGQTVTTSDTAIVFSTPTINASGSILATSDTIAIRRNPARANELEILTEPAVNSRRSAGIRVAARRIDYLGFRYAHTTPTSAKMIEVVTTSTASFRGRSNSATRGTAIVLENAP